MASKILIVDDSDTARGQIRRVLHKAGFEVEEAINGIEGLEKIRTQPDIAAVLCDINMPQMNGIEMAQVLYAEGTRPDLPMMVLTTEHRLTLLKAARAVGVRGWIIKPFKADQLVQVVRKLVAG
jgi:two-component system chemotaxis response regulator CheY